MLVVGEHIPVDPAQLWRLKGLTREYMGGERDNQIDLDLSALSNNKELFSLELRRGLCWKGLILPDLSQCDGCKMKHVGIGLCPIMQSIDLAPVSCRGSDLIVSVNDKVLRDSVKNRGDVRLQVY